ncbi:MAG TPA: hypothetical protein VKD22_11200 [Ramlibacter sp.]|nr:hypothetical protein [Ramlibacter sp.]
MSVFHGDDIVRPGKVPVGREQLLTCEYCGCAAWYREADMDERSHGAGPEYRVKCKQEGCPRWLIVGFDEAQAMYEAEDRAKAAGAAV